MVSCTNHGAVHINQIQLQFVQKKLYHCFSEEKLNISLLEGSLTRLFNACSGIIPYCLLAPPGALGGVTV